MWGGLAVRQAAGPKPGPHFSKGTKKARGSAGGGGGAALRARVSQLLAACRVHGSRVCGSSFQQASQARRTSKLSSRRRRTDKCAGESAVCPLSLRAAQHRWGL